MKAVLVIDMPNRCSECPLCSKGENYWGDIVSAECQMQYKGYLTLNEMEKPTWCPLRPLPSRKVPVFDPNSSSYDEEYEKRIMNEIDGWNACLEELEK